MKKAVLFHGCVVFLILFLALLPVISVAIAGTIADANGCQLDEGSIHPCVVNGQDIGSTLYSMGVMGWFMLATIPIGGIVLLVYLLAVLIFYLVRGYLRRQRTAAS